MDPRGLTVIYLNYRDDDDDADWCVLSGVSTNMLSVAAHEIGHALGISHSTERGSLMFAWYDSYNPVLTLHSDDIAAVQYLYGQQSFTECCTHTHTVAQKLTTCK